MNISRLSVKFLYTVAPLWAVGLLWATPSLAKTSPMPRNERLLELVTDKQTPSLSTGKGVRICIIDSGQSEKIPSLAEKSTSPYNALTNTTDVIDNDGHGTASAGIIHQLAPDALLIPVKSFDQGVGTIQSLNAGIDHCLKQKADIINLSGSGIEFVKDYIQKNKSAEKTIFVLAAGNSNDLLEKDPTRPKNIITVGATNLEKPIKATIYTSHGEGVDIYAPAGGINDGIETWTTNNTLRLFNGTSAATPVVSAALAKLKQSHPTLTASQLKDRILENTKKFSTGKTTTDIGFMLTIKD